MIERKHFKDINYKPFIFLVIFGAAGDKLQVSASRHHVDGFPEGLEMHGLNRDEHAEYIDGFLSGTLGDVLSAQDPETFAKCSKAHDCVIIKGEIAKDDTLDYMRNLIGIVKAFFDQGAAGVLDSSTFTLYSDESWTDKFFEKEVNAQNHAVIIESEEDGGTWLHTRGLLAFGRPDLSMHAKDDEGAEECRQVMNQMIFYSGEGVFFDGEFNIHPQDGKTYKIRSEFIEDFDNDDYNNAYCNVEIIERS